MAEYVCTITINRSARGEGDVPVLMAGASGTATKNTGYDYEAMEQALSEALSIMRPALDRIGRVHGEPFASPSEKKGEDA